MKNKGLVLLSFLILISKILHAQSETVDFESDRWNVVRGEVTEYLGRKCFTGRAFLQDVAFGNGIIECDVACDGARAFVGFIFRMESEEIYSDYRVFD